MKNSTVVLDNGSYTIKLGFADDKTSLVKLETPSRFDQDFSRINDEVFCLWEEGFSKNLALNFSDRDKIIVSRSLNQSEEESERILEEVFEKSGFKKAYLANKAILSFIHSGQETGLVIDIGHRQVDILPVYIGFPVPKGNLSLNYGGYNLTKTLRDRLESIREFSMKEVNEIKEKSCYTFKNKNDLTNIKKRSYLLQSGKVCF